MVNENKNKVTGKILLIIEITLLLILFSFLGPSVKAVIGEPNATVITWLNVGNVYPEVLNVSLNYDSPIILTPNATTTVDCIAVLIDYNGINDIAAVNATIYDTTSFLEDIDDNNYHYTNYSCDIIPDTGGFNGYINDEYHALANCTFAVEYYANAGDWTCSVTVNDSVGWQGTNFNTETVSELLALGVPDLINYSTVNATYVSDEQIVNITNYGNIQLNLSLEGYAQTQGDGLAMNCTLGNVGVIAIEHEKYNLTDSTPGDVTLSQAENFYNNLTTTPEIKRLELASRTNDLVNDAFTSSYWRIYVPRGVAGTCTGNIIFGATQANGT